MSPHDHRERVLGCYRCDLSADEGMNLTLAEAIALAKRVIIRHLRTDWLEWEDLPNLGEFAFQRLADAVEAQVDALSRDAVWHERVTGIDAADLESRAS